MPDKVGQRSTTLARKGRCSLTSLKLCIASASPARKDKLMAVMIEVDVGVCHTLDMTPMPDGSLAFHTNFFGNISKTRRLINWTMRDLEVASEYVMHHENYTQAERGFCHTLYQRGCMEPNYPVPALLTEVRYCDDGIEIRDSDMAKVGELVWFANETKLPF